MIGPAPGILKIFALILSSRWIKQWQKEKKQEQAQNQPSGKAPRPVKGQGPSADPKARKKGESQSFYDRIFSLQVTLWCMIFQRLNSDRTLDAVLKDLSRGGADHLSGRGKKISRRIQSKSTSAYSQARHRLPVAFLEAALEQMRRGLLQLESCMDLDDRPLVGVDG